MPSREHRVLAQSTSILGNLKLAAVSRRFYFTEPQIDYRSAVANQFNRFLPVLPRKLYIVIMVDFRIIRAGAFAQPLDGGKDTNSYGEY